MVYQNDVYGQGLYKAFLANCQAFNIQIPNEVSPALQQIPVDTSSCVPQIQALKQSQARILVFLGSQAAATRVFQAAFQVGLYGSDYIWLSTASSLVSATYTINGVEDAGIKAVMANMLGTTDASALAPGYKAHAANFKADPESVASYNAGLWANLLPDPYSPYAYDLAYIWGIALTRVSIYIQHIYV